MKNTLIFKDLYLYWFRKEGVDKQLCVLVPKQGLPKVSADFDPEVFKIEGAAIYTQGDVECFLDENGEKKYKVLSSKIINKEEITPDKLGKNTLHVQEVTEEAIRIAKEEELAAKAMLAQSLNIPPVPQELFIDKSVWNLLCTTVNLDKYPLLLGPKGCGKTETAYQLALAQSADFFPFNAGAAFKPKQFFVGMMHLRETDNGKTETVLIESEFLKAFKSEKLTYIFLDEITRVPQQAENYLMTILDKKQSYIYVEELGQRIYRGKGVRFIAAGNMGMQYSGTRTLDGAFSDRYQKFIVDYLPEEEELKLITQRAPKANPADIKQLILWANLVRAEEKKDNLTTGVSTRQLIDMAHYLEKGFPLVEVKDNLFLTNFINGNNEIEQVSALLQQV